MRALRGSQRLGGLLADPKSEHKPSLPREKAEMAQRTPDNTGGAVACSVVPAQGTPDPATGGPKVAELKSKSMAAEPVMIDYSNAR